MKEGIPVEVGLTKKMTFKDTITFNGTLMPENEVSISAEVNGTVEGVYFDFGSKVAKGALLRIWL